MMWILSGLYCFILWLVFAKLRLLRLSLPIAIIAGSVGPIAILTLLFCAQYYHPLTMQALALQKVIPVVPQMNQPGRVTHVRVEPNVEVRQGDVLFEVDPVPYQNSVNRLTAAVKEAQQSVKVAEASVVSAKATVARAQSDLTFATSERDRYQKLVQTEATTEENFERVVATYHQAATALNEATTSQTQAELSVDLANARLRQTQVELEQAQYDLDQTIVYAPADGFVTNLQLRPGMLVGGAGATAVMSFVQNRDDQDAGTLVGMFTQKNFLLIKPGQYAEVVLDSYPGQILTGKVETTIDANGVGQLMASGELPEDLGSATPARFAVRIALDNGKQMRIPAGMHGIAAVYTENVPIAGIPVMFVMRTESWLNYIF